jgi:hypothetical protein
MASGTNKFVTRHDLRQHASKNAVVTQEPPAHFGGHRHN